MGFRWGIAQNREDILGGAYLGQETAQEAAVAVHDGGAAPLSLGDDGNSLQLQEMVGKVRHGVLILLLGFNCSEQWRICLCTQCLDFLGSSIYECKLELIRGLFIGYLIPSHSPQGD
jgi:hypothetical protein